MPQTLLFLAGALVGTGGLLLQAYKWVSGQDMLQVCSQHLAALHTLRHRSSVLARTLHQSGPASAGCRAHCRVLQTNLPAQAEQQVSLTVVVQH